MEYIYSTGHNNGRVTQTIDGALNETVNYTYDNLHRLLTATATNNAWGEAYRYDGFGNLTAKTPTVGSAPAYASSGNSINNSPTAADANGDVLYGGAFPNAGWDVENRLTASQGVNPGDSVSYVYDPWGRRVWKLDYNTVGATNIEVYFYGTNGKVLETYGGQVRTQGLNDLAFEGMNTYFAGRMLSEKGVYVVTDRLGSVCFDSNGVQMSYFPWGEERTSTPDGRTKFAGYYRDMPGQDYAMARYYSASSGSFWSPDPGGVKTATGGDPTSWNRYSYVSGDPVNFRDPGGRIRESADCGPDWISDPSLSGPCCDPSDPDPACNVGGGGGGGGGGGSPLIPVTPAQRRASRLAYLRLLASAWAAGASASQADAPYPKYLKVVGDTYTCFGSAVERDIDYQLFDSNNNELDSGSITEHLTPTDFTNPIITSPGINTSSSPGGTFNDTISVQFGYNRTYDQTFSVSGASEGLAGFTNIPLYVVGFGGQFAILSITKTDTYVDINGDKGNPIKCK